MGTRGRLPWSVAAAWLAASIAPCALAQQRSRAFDDWWNRLVSRGADGPDIDGIAISYRIDYRPQISQADLERLKAEAARHPESSAAGKLAVLQASLSGGSSYRERTVWRHEGMWRINNTFARSPFAWDFVWGDGVGWQMTPRRLEVTSLTPGSPQAADLGSESSGATYESQLLLTGGLAGASGMGMRIAPTLISPGRWTAAGAITTERGSHEFTAEGTWHEESGWGTVSRSRIQTRASDGVVTWESNLFEGWQQFDTSALGIAGRVEVECSDATENTVITLQRVARFSPAEFKALISIPGPDDTDPIRGKVTYTSIEDHRSPTARQAAPLDTSEGVQVNALDAAGDSVSKLRIAGWVTAGGLAAAIVLIRVRRAIR
jgi:hypothetical protein